MLVPILAWAVAAVIALLVLGFCAYEITWKAARLRRDLGRLQSASEQLGELRAKLAAAQERASSAGLR